jgi:hypothetical protein
MWLVPCRPSPLCLRPGAGHSGATLDPGIPETGPFSSGGANIGSKAGMRAARRRGRLVGRPRRLTPDQLDHARVLIASNKGKGTVAALLGVHVATLRRALRAGP